MPAHCRCRAERCLRDKDAYFTKTVHYGKVIVGVTHMPLWQDALQQALAWVIQAFVESRSAAVAGAKP